MFKKFAGIVAFSALSWSLAGCVADTTVSERTSSVSAAKLSPINEACPVKPPANLPRPARLCGDEGYAYLLTMYVRPQCGGCHFKGSVLHWNAMGDADPKTAAWYARMYQKPVFMDKVMRNDFILPECEIRAQDPLYADFNEWWENPANCP